MSIRIDDALCIGCGACAQVCPGTLINMQKRKAKILYPRDCWGCASCLKECPADAISFFLGADIGGHGAVMHVKKIKNITDWIITKQDGTNIVLQTDSSKSNKY